MLLDCKLATHKQNLNGIKGRYNTFCTILPRHRCKLSILIISLVNMEEPIGFWPLSMRKTSIGIINASLDKKLDSIRTVQGWGIKIRWQLLLRTLKGFGNLFHHFEGVEKSIMCILARERGAPLPDDVHNAPPPGIHT